MVELTELPSRPAAPPSISAAERRRSRSSWLRSGHESGGTGGQSRPAGAARRAARLGAGPGGDRRRRPSSTTAQPTPPRCCWSVTCASRLPACGRRPRMTRPMMSKPSSLGCPPGIRRRSLTGRPDDLVCGVPSAGNSAERPGWFAGAFCAGTRRAGWYQGAGSSRPPRRMVARGRSGAGGAAAHSGSRRTSRYTRTRRPCPRLG